MPTPVGPLGEYIDTRRQELGLSWRRLSYLAGFSPETISMLVKREKWSKPRAETLRGLARALDVPYEQLLQLAGHLDPEPQGKPSPDVRHLIRLITDTYQEIQGDPRAVRQLVKVVTAQVEAIRVLAGRQNRE